MAQPVTGRITSGDVTWYSTSKDQHSKSKWSGDATTAILTLLLTDDFCVTLDETDTTHITGHFDAMLTHE